MEISQILSNTQYAFHGIVVGFVLVSAVLVYVFGFKSAVEPPFDKLTSSHEDRKVNGKKRKVKDKRSQSNGHAAAVGETRRDVKTVTSKSEKKDIEKSPTKDIKNDKKSSPVKKVALKENLDKKSPAQNDLNTKKKGKGKENVEVVAKNKKNKAVDEKPKDFDDGEWEQAPSRKDKKNKKVTLEDMIAQKPDKKKDEKKKKIKEETEVVSAAKVEATAEPEPAEAIPEPETQVELETAKPESKTDSDVELTPKPKRGGRKKKSSSESGTEERCPPEAAPKPPRQKKAQTPASPDASKADTQEPPASEPNVAFDELGDSVGYPKYPKEDTWKEAKPQKKGGKKKSRKD